ncbi:MAG TPA: cytochrome C oxidase subunit IV family protein [Polyangiaceae bacterium]|nr:cytochrome C oxidase subunit IV family protein [Polyangiaceae bacterium]
MREPTPRALLLTLVALLVLAGVSLAFRFAHLGDFGFAVALGIAAIKAVLVGLVFMEITVEKPTVRFAFAACLSLFALMIALLVADIVTRSPPPLGTPPGTEARYKG